MKKIEIKEISKGVFYVHNPSMQTAIASMWFCAGSIFDGDKHGLAHLFEHLLLQKTHKHKQGRYEYLESEGIEAYAHTYKEFSYVYHVSKPEHIVKSISLLQEGVFDAFFDETVLEHEKKVVVREIKQRTVYEKMWDSIYVNVYHNNVRQNPSLGIQDSLKTITLQDVTQFFKDRYAHGSCTYVIFSPQILTAVKKSQIQKVTSKAKVNDKKNFYLDESKVFTRETVLHDGDSTRYAASFKLPKVMNKKEKSIVYFIASIFSGNWNSMLTKKLRSEKPYTYWTYNSTLVTYKEKGLHFYFDIAKTDLKKVKSLVKDVFKNFSEHLLDQKELDLYRNIYTTNLYREAEDQKGLLFDIGSALCVDEEPVLPHEIVKEISQLTPVDIREYWLRVLSLNK